MKKAKIIKLGIGREFRSVETIEDEKEWIRKSIFLAIKERGYIKFRTQDNVVVGTLKLRTKKKPVSWSQLEYEAFLEFMEEKALRENITENVIQENRVMTVPIAKFNDGKGNIYVDESAYFEVITTNRELLKRISELTNQLAAVKTV